MKNCKNCRYKGRPTYIDPCAGCHEFDKFELKNTTTNADRIRAMSDEELFDFLEAVTDACYDRSINHCRNCPMQCGRLGIDFCNISKWLKQPAESD